MYTVSNKYKDVIYSGGATHRLSLLFNNVEYENANAKVEYVKVKSNILSNGEERFNLDNFVSKEVEIKIHDLDLDDIVEPINISIGTLVDNDYEYVPIGVFNLSEAPTKDGNTTTLKLRDNSIKFDVPYNAEGVINSQYIITTDEVYSDNKEYYSLVNDEYTLLIVGTDYEVGDTITGDVYQKKMSVTMLQLLQDICNTCGVTLETTTFINQNTEISVWDNTINARQYVMYVAEKAGSIATISRTGGLQLIPINNNLTTFNLDVNLMESFTEGDKFIISRVVYEDAIRKYEYGGIPEEEDWNIARQYTTLYINASNPYITDASEIEAIYNSINGFSIYGMKITKILGNPALDPYDLISFTYNGKTYTTFAQNELTYNGVMTQVFETNIGTLEKAQENVTVNTEEARFKRVYTNIDQMEGKIELNATETAENTTLINNQGEQIEALGTRLTQTTEGITAQVTAIQEQVDEGTNLVKTTSVTVNNDGISVATDTSEIETQITNEEFKITHGDDTLAWFGYDNTTNETKSEVNNLTVDKYFIVGNHRVEAYENNGEKHTGFFYIGG